MQIFAILLSIFIIELLVVLFFVPKSMLYGIFQQERATITQWFGQEKSAQMTIDAKIRFESWFVDTGIVEFIHDIFYYNEQDFPSTTSVRKEINDAPFFDNVNERIEFIWVIIESALMRIEMILITLTVSLCFLIPMVIDGLSQWQIQRSSDVNASINVYGVAENVFYFMLLIPLYLLFLPFSLSPLLMFIWIFILGFSAWCLTSNLQHRI